MTSSLIEDTRSGQGASNYELDEHSVVQHLARHGMELDRAFGAARLSGGLSNLNYLVQINGAKAVLRRPPMGELPPGAHDMVREHRILSRLSEAYPQAPKSFHLCEDMAVIGVPFQLLEYREGQSIRGDKMPADFDAQMCTALSINLVRTLASLHAVDASAVGLGGFGRPEGFYSRTVAGWKRRGNAITQDEATLRTINVISQWLERQQPAALPPTLLHSDFKLDNCMLGPDCSITTVLDWDMGTRGNPMMDLATLLSYWTEPDDPECMHQLAQMPTAQTGFLRRAQVAELYTQLTGLPIDDLPTWRILAMFKLGVVFLQLHRNWASGIAGDESYAGFASLGADLLDFTSSSLNQPL